MGNASIKEVAERAGVSVGTVSNVLNHPERVAQATRRRVQNVIAELGFVRNESARALRAGHSRTIGLVVLDVANPFFTDVASGAEKVADRHDAVITLCNSGNDAGREQRYLDHLEELRVQGVLITPVRTTNPRVEQLIERGIPVVMVDRGWGGRNMCSVAVDDVLGGRLAASHLTEQGHRRIAFIGGPMTVQQVADRHKGAFATVGESRGVSLRVLEMPALTIGAGRSAAQALADGPADQRPTALLCANDLLALGAMQELLAQGLRVPDDIAIIGYDDIEYAGAAAVPLSSVRQPREQLGRSAAELLFDEINDAEFHRHRRVVFEPELVVRASSNASARRRHGQTRDPGAA